MPEPTTAKLLERLATAHQELKEAESVRSELSQVVRATVVQLRSDGHSTEALAEVLGILPGPVRQLYADGRRDQGLPVGPPRGRQPEGPRRERRARVRPLSGDPLVARVVAIGDPVERLKTAHDEVRSGRRRISELSRQRREILTELDERAVATEELARALGVSSPQVRKLVLRARREAGLPIQPQRGGRRRAD